MTITRGGFLVTDNRILNGPFSCSLRLFARTAHPLTRYTVLRFAALASLARSIHGFAHSLCSLLRGTFEIHIGSWPFKLWTRSTGGNTFLVVTRNTPSVMEVISPVGLCKSSISPVKRNQGWQGPAGDPPSQWQFAINLVFSQWVACHF